MIPYIKIYDSSIINYIKYIVLPANFTERLEEEPLTYDSDLGGYVTDSNMVPLPTSAGRGWALFDETNVNGMSVVDTTAEQTTKVTVNGATTYDVDYLNGRILNPDAVPTSVSYSWNYVSFVEGWPGVDPPPLPVVALDIRSSDKTGFQLGGGTKDTLEGSVYVFATSESEKKEITDVIYQSLYNRSLTVGNWHEGSYLDFDGTYSGFQPTTVSGLSGGAFTEVHANLVGPRMDWSEVNRYRSQVDFIFEVYRDAYGISLIESEAQLEMQSSSEQSFQYTTTTEADSYTVTIPIAMTDTTYVVSAEIVYLPSGGEPDIRAENVGRTTSSFTLACGGFLPIGTVIDVIVRDR